MAVVKSFVVWGLCMFSVFLFVINLHTFEKQYKEAMAYSDKQTMVYSAPKYVESSEENIPYENVKQLRQVLHSLDFLKTGSGYCTDIASPYNRENPGLYEGFDNFLTELQGYDKLVEEARQTSKKAKGEKLEGYSAQLNTSLQVYWRLAKLPFVNTVCETGFNAGHSSFLWLSANPKLHVYSFDIGIHKYARKMAAYLQNRYPQRLNVTWGDSTKMLPSFHSNHLDIKCDLVIIDGGHTVPVAKADFDNFYHLANDLHVVLIDDHPAMKASWSKGPREAWEGGKLSGKLYEIGGCTIQKLNRGISIGFYILEQPH